MVQRIKDDTVKLKTFRKHFKEADRKTMCSKLKFYYNEIFAYFRRNRLWCWLTVLLIAELLIYCCLNTTPNGSYEQYVAEAMPAYSSQFLFIVAGNIQAALWLVALGTVPLGLGILAGSFSTIQSLVATAKWLIPIVGSTQLFFTALPHGIFEITALILSIVISTLWSTAVTQAIIRVFRRRFVLNELKEHLLFVIKSALLLIIPLIFVSAIIEVTISSAVLYM